MQSYDNCQIPREVWIKEEVTRKTLDLGCGHNIRNPFSAEDVYGIDIVDAPFGNMKKVDLAVETIPFPDNFFDYVTAYDFLEHIPRLVYYKDKKINSFIEIMNEVWRVLKPGGIFKAHTPCYPSNETFTDPTHVNFITPETVNYFTGGGAAGLYYGFKGSFRIIKNEWDTEWTYWRVWELEAIK